MTTRRPSTMADLARELGVQPLPSHVVQRPPQGARPIATRIATTSVDLGAGNMVGLTTAREADIMSRLPDADIVGMRGPGVVPGGEQRQGARRAAAEQAIPEPPTFRPLAGAQQNNRGAAVLVNLPTVGAPASVTVPSLVETPKHTGDDAEMVTVTCGLALPADFPIGSDFVEVVGTIEFGTGGAIFRAEFDWLAGTVFAIPTSTCRVTARVNYELTADPTTITLMAALGYGQGMPHTVSPLRRTFAFDIAAGGTQADIRIPSFATAVSLVHGPDVFAAVDYLVIFAGANGRTALYRYNSASNLGNQRDGQFPIPGWATHMLLTNQGATPTAPSLIFTLSL